ncbi:MAG: HAD-IA family hydrolase [Rhodospirillaceae bacterium]
MTDRLKLAAFDFDGTLLDSIPSIVIGVTACWKALGFPDVEPDRIRNIIGLPWEQSIELLMPGAGEREVAMIHNYHAEIAGGLRPPPERPPETLFPGAVDLLDALEADDYLLAVVTSRSNRRFLDLIESTGLGGRFVTVKTADQGPGKPNPFLLQAAMREAGVEIADTVMIGDTTYDVMTGRNAGTGAIGVTWGVHPEDELRGAGAHHTADEFHELVGLIDCLIEENRAAG